MVPVRVILAFFVAGLVAGCSDSSGPTLSVGGTITGLSSSGLVLQNNGGGNLTVASGAGTFAFSSGIANGSAYNITVLTQPVTQNCAVSNGSGTVASASVTNVTITCTTPTFTVGGTVTGLSGAGLVIQNNGGNNLALTANGTFGFSPAIASGSPYAVTVLTFPTNQNCIISNSAGTVAKANVTDIVVGCFSPFAQWELVTAGVTTGAVGSLGNISVNCPGAKRALGGGYRSGNGAEVWRVWRSRPVDVGGGQPGQSGWSVSFTSVVADQAVSVYAVCGDPAQNMAYEILTTTLATGAPGTAGTVSRICGGTRRVVGGGYSSESASEVWRVGRNRGVDATGLVSGNAGWALDFTSVVAGQTVTVHAVCAQSPQDLAAQVVTANVTTGAPGTLGTVSAFCPTGKRVTGGGFLSANAIEALRVWRSYPVEAGVQVGDRGWSIDFTSVVAGQTVSAFALCGFVPLT